MKPFGWTATLIFLSLFSLISPFKCGHNKLNITKKIVKLTEEKSPTTRKLDELVTRPIEFFIDYSFIEQKVNLSSSTLKNIKQGIDETVKIFQKLLTVTSAGNIKFNESLDFCQDGFGVSSELSKGINADVAIFPIVLDESELGEGVIASAGACLITEEEKRPFVGVLNLGKSHNFSTRGYMKVFKMTLLHEISHILGFSSGLFEFFPHKDPVKKVTVNGIERYLLATPKVLETAREHFGCQSLEGVELEDQGGDGSAGSHWESRLMLSDYMISTDYEDLVISPITLALFEDSGWYKVEYLTGGLFKFGKGKGCEFLNSKCLEAPKNNPTIKFTEEFCKTSGEQKCFPSRTGKGVCGIFNYKEDLETQYQYFSDPKIGGFEPADFCPVTASLPNSYGYLSGHCQHGDLKNLNEESDEVFGKDSMCIDGEASSSSGTTKLATCYKVSCKKDSLTISVGKEKVKCSSSEGGVKKSLKNFENYSIVCPDFEIACPMDVISSYCNDFEDCVLSTGSYVKLSISFCIGLAMLLF